MIVAFVVLVILAVLIFGLIAGFYWILIFELIDDYRKKRCPVCKARY